MKSLYEDAVEQSLPVLALAITRLGKYSKWIRKGMLDFESDLIHSIAHGSERPQLRATTTRNPYYLQGWNIAYAITYPYLTNLKH